MEEEKIAEFVGIMLGDGSIGIYNTKSGEKEGNRIKVHRVVKVTLDSRNEKYIDHIVNIFKEILRVEPVLHYKKNENAVDVATHGKDSIDFVLNKIGLKISPKWGKMEIPEKYSRGKLSLFVLKGLFDTDGHLSIFNNNGTIYPRIEIRLCPSPAQDQFSKILNEFGFIYKIQNLDKGKTRIRISGRDQLKKWFELVGSSNPIHLEKLKKLS